VFIFNIFDFTHTRFTPARPAEDVQLHFWFCFKKCDENVKKQP